MNPIWRGHSRKCDVFRGDKVASIDRLFVTPLYRAELEQVEQRYISQATEITDDVWDTRPQHRRFLQNMARLCDSFL